MACETWIRGLKWEPPNACVLLWFFLSKFPGQCKKLVHAMHACHAPRSLSQFIKSVSARSGVGTTATVPHRANNACLILPCSETQTNTSPAWCGNRATSRMSTNVGWCSFQSDSKGKATTGKANCSTHWRIVNDGDDLIYISAPSGPNLINNSTSGPVDSTIPGVSNPLL